MSSFKEDELSASYEAASQEDGYSTGESCSRSLRSDAMKLTSLRIWHCRSDIFYVSRSLAGSPQPFLPLLGDHHPIETMAFIANCSELKWMLESRRECLMNMDHRQRISSYQQNIVSLPDVNFQPSTSNELNIVVPITSTVNNLLHTALFPYVPRRAQSSSCDIEESSHLPATLHSSTRSRDKRALPYVQALFILNAPSKTSLNSH